MSDKFVNKGRVEKNKGFRKYNAFENGMINISKKAKVCILVRESD